MRKRKCRKTSLHMYTDNIAIFLSICSYLPIISSSSVCEAHHRQISHSTQIILQQGHQLPFKIKSVEEIKNLNRCLWWKIGFPSNIGICCFSLNNIDHHITSSSQNSLENLWVCRSFSYGSILIEKTASFKKKMWLSTAFGRANICLLMDLHGRIQWQTVLERHGHQESWLFSKSLPPSLRMVHICMRNQAKVDKQGDPDWT